MSNTNPYVSPSAVPPASKTYTTGTRRLEYGEMFGFAFTNPNWTVNVLWGSGCLLAAYFIPILPQLLLSGYLWEVLEKRHLRETDSYPDFDINRFTDYLTRSIWPFLASLIASFAMMFVVGPLFLLMGVMIAVAESQKSEALAIITILGGALLSALVMLPLQALMMPIMLRAGLAQDLGAAFNFAWIKEFVRLTWKELLLGGLVLMIGGFAMIFMGLMVRDLPRTWRHTDSAQATEADASGDASADVSIGIATN
jgi:hypothetical protein